MSDLFISYWVSLKSWVVLCTLSFRPSHWSSMKNQNVKEGFCYTRVQNVCPGWKTAGNQGNHQNFDPTLLTKKLWPFNMRMKQKKIFFFEILFFKMAAKKKLIFQNRQFTKKFHENFLDWFTKKKNKFALFSC